MPATLTILGHKTPLSSWSRGRKQDASPCKPSPTDWTSAWGDDAKGDSSAMVNAVPASPYLLVSQPPAGSLRSTVLAGRFGAGAWSAAAPASSSVARCMVFTPELQRSAASVTLLEALHTVSPTALAGPQRDLLKRGKPWEAVRRSPCQTMVATLVVAPSVALMYDTASATR